MSNNQWLLDIKPGDEVVLCYGGQYPRIAAVSHVTHFIWVDGYAYKKEDGRYYYSQDDDINYLRIAECTEEARNNIALMEKKNSLIDEIIQQTFNLQTVTVEQLERIAAILGIEK